jgi:hypothetical protein
MLAPRRNSSIARRLLERDPPLSARGPSDVRPARSRFQRRATDSPSPARGTMIDRSARLMIALLVLLLIWWVLGALCRSLLTTVDLRAVRDVAYERTPAQTTMAHAMSLIGSGYVVFPLTLVGCAILYLVGRSRRSLAVGLGMLGAVVIANVDKLLVGRSPRAPSREGDQLQLSLRPLGSGGRIRHRIARHTA